MSVRGRERQRERGEEEEVEERKKERERERHRGYILCRQLDPVDDLKGHPFENLLE